MTIKNIHIANQVGTLEECFHLLAQTQKTLKYLLDGNLDFINIRAGGIIAETIDVEQLSAISANLGHITAGLIEAVTIYGSKIATSESSFPRAEMSETELLFRVMLSATSYAEFAARAGFGAGETPALRFIEGPEEFVLGHGAVLGGYMGLKTNGYLMISAAEGVNINWLRMLSWHEIYNATNDKTLAAELGALTNSISSLTSAINNKADSGSSTGSSGSHNHGISNGTELMTVGGGSVTWFSANGHSHTQN